MYVDNEKGTMRFIKAKSMEIQYGNGSSLAYCNQDIMVFTNMEYLSIQGGFDNSDSVTQKLHFEYLISEAEPKLCKFKRFIVMLNRNIDKIAVKPKKTFYFPKVSCQVFKLVLNSNPTKKSIKHIVALLKSLDPKTKLELMLYGNLDYPEDSPLGPILTEINKFCVIKLVITCFSPRYQLKNLIT